MGLHLCPIEPSDWSDGPDDPEPIDCPHCEGFGILDDWTKCPRCEGDGFVYPEYEPFPDDYL